MSIPNITAIRTIHNRFRDDDDVYYFLALMDRSRDNKWTEYPYTYGAGIPLEHQPHGCDIFFSPLGFSEPRRSNSTVLKPSVLFADLDRALYPAVDPSVYWNTSEGNFQAVWFLSEPVEDYDKWAQLNKRMTRFTGADPGGWMGSKVLRVPGSVNWKRKDFGTLLEFTNRVYTYEHLDEFLPPAEYSPASQLTDWPEPPDTKDREWLWRLAWPDLSMRARSALTRSRVPDRSLHIVRLINELHSCGVSAEEAFRLIWVAPFNKWRLNNKPEVLWNEVQRVYS